MPLEEYESKRDFSATPEPAGGAPTPPGQPRRFVVQQHHARAMHWDFRLELDGVLMSWAVPKGPSYDTRDKRLAVHVEDHPLDYANFEGVIPAGEYGAGNVIVWDRGTWEPLTDPHAGLAKGDFKFKLSGEKLVGGWVLVRLKPRPGEKRENWLLIKEKDEHAKPHEAFDVTAERPESVISGVAVDEVGSVGGAEGVQTHSSPLGPPDTPSASSDPAGGAAAAGDVQPIEAEMEVPPELALCTLVTTAPSGDGWLGEVKYDGYRLTIAVSGGQARCYSRNGADVTDRFAPLARAAKELPATSALLDGEAVVFDERGVSSFGMLQDALGSAPERVVFSAFDLLHLNGYDLRPLPTLRRKDLLRALLPEQPATGPLRFAEFAEGGVDAMLEIACAQGLEGVVAKRADSPYPRGRTRSWLKIKCRRSQEFVVGGYTEPKGSRKGFGALLLGYYEGERLVYAGRVGSGFNERQLHDIYATLKTLERTEPPFDRAPELPEPHWVEPQLVAQVAFAEWTSDGVLRQPSFLGLRDDVDPGGVVREAAAEDGASEPAEAGADADTGAGEPAPAATSSAVVEGIRISNPDKQLFPGGGFAKSELAAYYAAIAPLMLPEVAERPLTLIRCPVGDGRGGCFYQRHPDRGLPGHVGTLSHALAGHAEADEWLYIKDAAGLVALAQMGVAEIHTWLSRTDAPRRPDRIVFDLDPGDDVSWEQIVSAAHIVREECATLGFTPFVKSTGSKGLHLVIPIEPVWEFERIRALARAIAEKISARHPDALTPKMSKALRPGRIFIDYVRNSEAASAVAPYSTRYLEGPPVAVPLAWDELTPSDDVRRAFTPARVIERAKAGVDPWSSLDGASVGVRVLKAAEESLGTGA